MITQKLKDTFRGILLATFTWMIVLPLSQKLVDFSPIKDTLIVGIAGLLIILFVWDGGS